MTNEELELLWHKVHGEKRIDDVVEEKESLLDLMSKAIVRTREKELEREGLPSEGVTIRRLEEFL